MNVCVQVPCVYLLSAASTVIRNNMYVIVYFVVASMHVWSRKSQAKCPNWGSQAKQHPWEGSEGVYK